MKRVKNLLVVTIITLFGASGLVAQTQQQAPQMPDLPTSAEVSDEEVVQIVNTIVDLEPIQIKAQAQIVEALEAEDLTIERFQQMMMSMQNPQMADQVNVTEEEMAKLQTLQPLLIEIQGEADQEMVAVIEDNGLTMERYRGIVMGAQQDPELMARIEVLLDTDEEEG
ncbi:MAG: DUF4168 domain-containing protein [Balneolaceae bacterium]